ncbi:MAG: hypothetical protein GX155_03165 [Smithella sp.]|nr:hypothetical protein [Smithella sp.]
MYSARKKETCFYCEKGFVLLSAIIAMMILMAVGFLALTITSDDLKITSRLYGERKALSAAEAGVHDLCVVFDASMDALTNVKIDATNDPKISYSTTKPVPDPNIPSVSATGSSIEGGKSWSFNVFYSEVTGRDESHGSLVRLGVGLRHGEVPSTPAYQ